MAQPRQDRRNDARRSRMRALALRLSGVLLTGFVIALIELLPTGQINLLMASLMMGLSVVIAANRGGTIIGLACAAMAGAYLAYVLPTLDRSSTGQLTRTFFVAGAMAAVAIIVGQTRARLDRLQRERDLERQSTEAQLRGALRDVARAQSEVRLQARLLEEVGQAVVATDASGNVVYANGAACRLFGREPAAMIGRPVTEVAPVPDPVTNYDDTIERIGRPSAWVGEARVSAADGPLRQMLVTDAPLFDDQGVATGMVRVMTDLSSRRRAERNQRILADAGAVLSASLDYASTLRNLTTMLVPDLADACVIDVVDEAGVAQRMHARHVDTRKEPIVRAMRRRYPLGLDSDHPAAVVMRTGTSNLMHDIPESMLRHVAVDGEHLRLLRTLDYRTGIIVALRSGDRTFGALSMFRGDGRARYDDMELRLAEELARRAASAIEHARLYEQSVLANRAKGDFLAVMSHELRTPLTAIIGYADLMLSSIPQEIGERGEKFTGRIRSAADHLLGLIDQILVFSRLEVGRLDTQPEQLSVGDVIADVSALIEPIAKDRQLDFRVPRPPAILLETDLGKLRQVLLNLLTNALKFTEQGSVELSVIDEPEHVVFCVKDTGPGIEPGHLEHIFDPFWQVDQSSTRRAGGTGLGLTVSRRLARLLGGDIEVRSRVARGSVFRVRLPKRWQGRDLDAIGEPPAAMVEVASGAHAVEGGARSRH